MKNISWSIFITGFLLAIIIGQAGLFLPILLITIGINLLVRAWMTGESEKKFRSLSGFIWCMTFALCFGTGYWSLLLLGAILSTVLHITHDQIIATINGWDTPKIHAHSPAYPLSRPAQTQVPYTPYEQGYQPLYPAHNAEYTELPPAEPTIARTEQYEQPQALYPQQMPPQ